MRYKMQVSPTGHKEGLGGFGGNWGSTLVFWVALPVPFKSFQVPTVGNMNCQTASQSLKSKGFNIYNSASLPGHKR